MRRLDPDFLVPSHTQPLRGRELIEKQLRDYRDGIQWVYVSTVRGANAGRTVDDLAETVGRAAVGCVIHWGPPMCSDRRWMHDPCYHKNGREKIEG
jgi:hypothetical protein